MALDRAIPVAEPHHPPREVYPYSVIPGGVYTSTELVDAVADDPAVAEHYADVEPTAMHVEVVDAVREAYMSYRLGDRIFWTKRKLPLRNGERILTAGDVAVRARCGNRLSDVPMTPTSDAEPPAEEFERDAAPLFPVGNGLDGPIAAGPPFGFWGGGSVPPGMTPTSDGTTPTSDGGSPGAFFSGGGLFRDVGRRPVGDRAPDAVEPDGEQPPIVFVLPPANDAGPADPPDRGGRGDGPSVNVDIPGFTHVEHPGDGGSSGESSGETLLVPETSGGSDGELPLDAVVPEPTTLTLLGTGLLWGAVKRHRRRTARPR